MKNLTLVIGFVIASASIAGARSGRVGWDGTGAGGWDRNAGVQLIFAGDTLIGFYWRDDYKAPLFYPADSAEPLGCGCTKADGLPGSPMELPSCVDLTRLSGGIRMAEIGAKRLAAAEIRGVGPDRAFVSHDRPQLPPLGHSSPRARTDVDRPLASCLIRGRRG